MSGLVSRHPLRRPSSRPALGAGVLLAAIVAASLAFGAHHVLPLRGHTAETVVFVVAGAALVALAAGLLAVGRNEDGLAAVVVVEPGAVELHGGTKDDLLFCAALHVAELEHGFFTALGPRFLRAYHATFIDSPHAVSIVASIGGHPVGFVAGLLRPREHARWVLRRRGPRLAALGAAALLARPVAALRFARTRLARYVRTWRRHRRELVPPTRGNRETGAHEAAALSHLAVSLGARGSGAGRRLTEAFADAARAAGAPRVALVTLEGEDGAGRFYARLGWEPGELRMTPDGRAMREWRLEVSP
jgi:ribosomal protein S18 acetylase RimI-like enzyme